MLSGAALWMVDAAGLWELARASANSPAPPYQPLHRPGEGFPQSVAAGDPTPSGAVIWTRVDPAVAPGVEARALDSTWVRWLSPQGTRPDPEVLQRLARRGEAVLFELSESPSFQ